MKNIHYIVPGREKQPIELMRLGLNDAEFEGYCVGNVMKYVLRYKCKGGQNDLYKAREYIDFLIRSLNREPILGDEEENDEEAIWDDEEAWRCWTCQNNRDLSRVVTRTYKE